jgi:hypothetical protein
MRMKYSGQGSLLGMGFLVRFEVEVGSDHLSLLVPKGNARPLRRPGPPIPLAKRK